MRAANSAFTQYLIPKARQNYCLLQASAENDQLRIRSINLTTSKMIQAFLYLADLTSQKVTIVQCLSFKHVVFTLPTVAWHWNMLRWPIKSVIANYFQWGPTQKGQRYLIQNDLRMYKQKISLNKSSLILGHCISTEVILGWYRPYLIIDHFQPVEISDYTQR